MIDFLVIGGGIAGISAGARLSALGQVLVLEAEDALAYHSSGRSAAMFEEAYGNASTIALNRASKEYHVTANGGVLSPRGLLMLCGPGDEDAFDHDLVDMAMDEISVQDALNLVPTLNPNVVMRAGYHGSAQDLDTDRLIQNFVREIKSNGGQIQPSSQVNQIDRDDIGWTVHCGSSAYSARTLINAAGSWADQVAQMAGLDPIGLQPFRRSIARVEAPDGHDPKTWPMIFGPGETWYAKPDAGALLVSPADEDPVDPHDAWAEDLTLAEGIARYEAYVTTPVTRMISNWAGLRTFAPDRALVIGPDPQDPCFFWSAGQGGYGFQTAPAASALLASLVSGGHAPVESGIIAQLLPGRFR